MLSLARFYKFQYFNFLRSKQGITAPEYAMIAVAISTLLTIVFGDQNSGLLSVLSSAFTQVTTTIKAILIEY